MKQHDAIHVLEKRYRNLKRYYPDILEEFDVEAIHHFRLDVKKLRAFLRLLNACGKQQNGLQIGNKLHDFYHAAGIVRCLQLQKVMVQQWCRQFHYAEPLTYLSILYLKEEDAKVILRMAGQIFSVDKEESRVMKAARHGLDGQMEESFVTLKKAALLQCFSANELNDEIFHTIRKVLKDLLYVWNYVAPFFEEVFGPKSLTRDACIQLTDCLGDFQDVCIALTFLTKEYVDAVQDLHESAVLQRLHTYCVGRKAELEHKIVFMLQPLRKRLLGSGRLPGPVSASSFQILKNSI